MAAGVLAALSSPSSSAAEGASAVPPCAASGSTESCSEWEASWCATAIAPGLLVQKRKQSGFGKASEEGEGSPGK